MPPIKVWKKHYEVYEARARVGRPLTSSSPTVFFIAGHPKAALLFWYFSDLDVARCYSWLFTLYINIENR